MARMHPTYSELVQRWKALRAAGDLRLREVACVGAPRTLICADYGDALLPSVLLTAGVHGDEPAGPLALLELVSNELLDSRFSYRIWPCTNPTGFDLGTRESSGGVDINRTFGRGGSSPEAKAILTANRDHKFLLSIDLHEDDEAAEFYTYEYGFAAPLFPSALQPDPKEEAALIGGLSLTLLLIRNASLQAITIETPSSRVPLDRRVAMHVEAVRSVLRQLPQASQTIGK